MATGRLATGKRKKVDKSKDVISGTYSSYSEFYHPPTDDELEENDVETDSISESLIIFNRLSVKKVASPVIAMLVNINYESRALGKYFIEGGIITMFKYFGARVKPVWLGQDVDYYHGIFRSTNGLFIPNYPMNLESVDQEDLAFAVDTFCRAVIMAQSSCGTYWPIWAVGYGMQMLIMSSGAKNIVNSVREEFTGSIRLKKTMDTDDSTFLCNMPPDILKGITQCTSAAVSYKMLTILDDNVTRALKEQFNVTFVCRSLTRKTAYAVAMIEAKRFPFYGSVFQPHILCTIWSKEALFDRSLTAARFANYQVSFLVNEACRNGHLSASEINQQDFQMIDYYHCDSQKCSANNTEAIFFFGEKPSDGIIRHVHCDDSSL